MILTAAFLALSLQSAQSLTLTQATTCFALTGGLMDGFEAAAATPDATEADRGNLVAIRELRTASQHAAAALARSASDEEKAAMRTELNAVMERIMNDEDAAWALLDECAELFDQT